jgi:5-methylcytosine-specific restriction endonuclease McrA
MKQKRVVYDVVHPKYPDLRSRGSYVLLRNFLEAEEQGHSQWYQPQLKTKRMTLVFDKDPHIKSRAAYIKLVRKLKKKSKYNWERNMGFRKKTLTKWLEERGSLECEYCKHGPLEINCQGKSKDYTVQWQATLDHIVSKDRDKSKKYDVDNVVVSCHDCNTLKGNMSLIEFQPILDEKLARIEAEKKAEKRKHSKIMIVWDYMLDIYSVNNKYFNLFFNNTEVA